MLIKEKLKQLPQRPGVYLMEDSLGNIIYVGKAKNLKLRVSQYFYDMKDREPKVAEMIDNIHTFHYRVKDTELEAFLEECRLIKELQPRYNRQMKNFRKYSYLKIPKEEYPKLMIVNDKSDDTAVYFGPFTSVHGVESAVHYLNDVYLLRKCPSPGLVKKPNGCLFRDLGTCLGVCTGQVSSEKYWVQIEKLQKFLNGNDQFPVQELRRKLDSAIEQLDFEKAARYKESYMGLRHILSKQSLVQSSRKNRNILAVEFMDTDHAKLFLIKGNRLLYQEALNRAAADSIESRRHLIQIIKDTFTTAKNDHRQLTQYDIDEAQIIYSYLKKNRKRIQSFWIPSTRLNNEISLNAIITKIIDQV